MTNRGNRLVNIGKCLDRLEKIYEKNDWTAMNDLRRNRFNYFIDLDVSKVNVDELLKADDCDFMHDVIGIFNNIERNPEEPEKSSLKLFVPRVGII